MIWRVDITYLIGDATQPVGDGPRIIAHVCNDRGWWGNGFVLAVSDRWPNVRREYQHWFQNTDGEQGSMRLGMVQYVPVGDRIEIANMIGQEGVRTRSGRPPIRYEALRSCLRTVGSHAIAEGASVHMPRIGCGLAGGDWGSVEPLIVEQLCERGVPVTVYDLG